MFHSLLRQSADIYQPNPTNNGGIQTINRALLWSFPARLSSYSKPWLINLTNSKMKHVQVKEYMLFLEQTTAIEKWYKVTIESIDYEVIAVARIGNASSAHHKECILQLRQ